MLNAFLDCEEHISADELHKLVTATEPKVGLATVYRTIALLIQSGLASEMVLRDAAQKCLARIAEGLGEDDR